MMTTLVVVLLLAFAIRAGVWLWRLERHRRRGIAQFVTLTAQRRASLDETSTTPDIGAGARPGATVVLPFHTRNGRRTEGWKQGP